MDGPLAKSIPVVWLGRDGVLGFRSCCNWRRNPIRILDGCRGRSLLVCLFPPREVFEEPSPQFYRSWIILGLFPYMKLKQYLHILKYCFLPCLKVYVFFMDVIEIKMLHVQVSCHRTGCNVLNNTLIYY